MAAAAEDPKKKKSDGWQAPGFAQALEEALLPIMTQEKDESMEELQNNVGKKIMKAVRKYANDERTNSKGTATEAQVVIHEYVESAMGAITTSLYDRPWVHEVNFVPPLLAALKYCFTGCKIFNRVVSPQIERYVETSLAHYREEERIQKAMWDAVEATGIKDSFKKKAFEKLSGSYDDAHVKAPYGTNVAETPELGMLQDFVKGWMYEFVHRSHDVLNYGVATESNKTTRDEQVLFVTVLFQNLCDSKNVCLPNDLTSLIPTPPAHPWSYVAEAAETVFTEVATAKEEERANKGGKGNGGKGKTNSWEGKGDDWSGYGGYGGYGYMPDPWMMMKGKAMMKGMKGGPYGKGGYGKGW